MPDRAVKHISLYTRTSKKLEEMEELATITGQLITELPGFDQIAADMERSYYLMYEDVGAPYGETLEGMRQWLAEAAAAAQMEATATAIRGMHQCYTYDRWAQGYLRGDWSHLGEHDHN